MNESKHTPGQQQFRCGMCEENFATPIICPSCQSDETEPAKAPLLEECRTVIECLVIARENNTGPERWELELRAAKQLLAKLEA
jgi:hypothetical protein